MFASKVTLPLKLKSGFAVVIKKLSYSKLEKAYEVRIGAELAQLRAMGGDVLQAFDKLTERLTQEQKDAEAPEKLTPEQRKKRLYARYDQKTVLEAGIKSWDADEAVKPETINDLDKQDAQEIYEAIVDLSDPLPEESKDAEGKD